MAAKAPRIQIETRNTVFAMGLIALLPTFVLLLVVISSPGAVQWRGVTFIMAAYSGTLGALSIFAGVLCGQGQRLGRLLAFVPAALLVLNFPIGTVFSVIAIMKLNRPDFIDSLVGPEQ